MWLTDASVVLFWVSVVGVLYAYVGYPLLLAMVVRLRSSDLHTRVSAEDALPHVTMIVPVHNERTIIEGKLDNTQALRYPEHRLEVLFVSDASTDGTNEAIAKRVGDRISLIALNDRGGKAAALNAGLAQAQHDIVVFSDASILFELNAIREIVEPFQHASVGCVSGEDWIPEVGGEALYGRYELYLRRLESRLGSIVGASGSFYAQRRVLCDQFVPLVAPDFLSVLLTVRRGLRAVTCPTARGCMTALDVPADEFERKVRTVLRGMTTLARHATMMNPFRYGTFAFALISHKLARWLVPFFLIGSLVSSLLLTTTSIFYLLAALGQVGFYALAVASLHGPDWLRRTLLARVAVYFTGVNLATLLAGWKFATGTRQELWEPTRREAIR